MVNIEPPLYIRIDSSWSELPGYNTGGTRDKNVFIDPSGETYFFKTSINQGKKNYPYEFWSEIAASRLGKLLKLPVLDYNIASYENKIGCLSKSMINIKTEDLIEGVNLIIEVEPDFKDYCKTNHHIMKIEKALKSVGLIEFRRIVVEMVLFDCLIGNTDRHSENWALIRNRADMRYNAQLRGLNLFKRIFKYLELSKEFKIPYFKVHKRIAHNCYKFAPFYDNGSSLGRELTEERIKKLMNDDNAFYRFFSGGQSDIIIGYKKTSFLETIDTIVQCYYKECAHFVTQHLSLYNKEDFSALIRNMDCSYPIDSFTQWRISEIRKSFIIELVDARVNYIRNIIKGYGK